VRVIVGFGDAVAFAMVHPHWIGFVDVGVGCAPVLVIALVVVREFLLGFVDDLLAGVVDEGGFPDHGVFDFAPTLSLVVETDDFVSEATGFEEGGFKQLLALFNSELEGEEKGLLHTRCVV